MVGVNRKIKFLNHPFQSLFKQTKITVREAPCTARVLGPSQTSLLPDKLYCAVFFFSILLFLNNNKKHGVCFDSAAAVVLFLSIRCDDRY